MMRSLALLGFIAALLPGCRDETPPEPTAPPPATPDAASATPAAPDASAGAPPGARPDWAAMRAAEAACADCHPDEVAAWRASPMGRSMGPATGEGMPGGPATVQHPATGERFTVDASGLTFAEAGGLEATARHVIGSGSHTRSFAHRETPTPETHRALLMPLTWYRTAGWGLSPGYTVPDHPGFHRAMNLECLTCHNDPAATATGDDERFVEPFAHGIGCARCHGDGRPHVKARLAGEAAPMIMPGRLDASLGADVCGQCHLQGAVRLLRAGRRWDAFVPGQPLGEVVAVFARQTPGAGIGIASHAERLRRSACASKNPDAGRCTTCHTPHPTGTPPDRSAACRGCHGPAATIDGAHGAACAGAGGEDCAGCHMARTATDDIPHVSMTDHFIRRVPDAATGPASDSGPLVWINRPDGVPEPIARRLLGRAWAESARGRVSSADRERALALLEPALREAPDDPAAWADLASMKTLAGDAIAARAALEEAVKRAGEADVRAQWWTDLARLRLRTGAVDDARAALDRARTLRPNHPDDRLVAAQIAAALGDTRAVDAELTAYEKARGDTPDGMMLRGALARAGIEPDAADAAFAEAAARAPGDPAPQLALCRLRADRRRWDAAADACQAAARSARGAQAVARVAGARARIAYGRGDHASAAQLAAAGLSAAPADASLVLGRLALDGGRLDDALSLLDRAVRLDPTLADAWAALADVLRRRGETALADRAAAQARRMGAP